MIGAIADFAASGLFGGLIGGLLRLAPTIVDYFKTRQANKHEVDMMGLTMQRDKLLAEQAIAKIEKQAQMVLDKGGLEALREAIARQGAPTGIRWVDALSATVRPVVTYWYLCLYSVVKMAMLTVAVVGAVMVAAAAGSDAAGIAVEIAQAIAGAWTPADMGLFTGIMNFWFLDRVLRKNEGR